LGALGQTTGGARSKKKDLGWGYCSVGGQDSKITMRRKGRGSLVGDVPEGGNGQQVLHQNKEKKEDYCLTAKGAGLESSSDSWHEKRTSLQSLIRKNGKGRRSKRHEYTLKKTHK